MGFLSVCDTPTLQGTWGRTDRTKGWSAWDFKSAPKPETTLGKIVNWRALCERGTLFRLYYSFMSTLVCGSTSAVVLVQLGLSAWHYPMDATEAIRSLLQEGYWWGHRIQIASLDMKRRWTSSVLELWRRPRRTMLSRHDPLRPSCGSLWVNMVGRLSLG